MESMVLKMRKTKDSGIEWIGEIPEGWEITKIKHIVSSVTDIDHFMPDSAEFGIPYLMIGDLKDLSSSIDWDSSKKISIEDYKKLSIKSRPQIGDIIFARYASIGTTCYIDTDRDFLVSYACLTIHPSDLIIGKFLSYYLKSSSFAEDVLRRTNSNTQGNVGKDSLVNATIVLPSIIEQTQIVNFLDAKCSDINAMLSKTRASIEEYKKLKQAVITQAVTKGVRGEREMKDSGNPWFGQIPTDWKLSRVGLHFSIILGKMLCNAPLNDTYTLEPYYCAADVHFDGVADGERKKMWFSPIEKDLYRVSVGDLLVVEGGAGAGGSAIVQKQDSDTYVQNSIMIVRSKGNADNRYLRYLLEFLVKQGYIDVVCNKATIPHFTKDKLSCVPFCLCGEQEEIADYLDAKCAEIDKLIAKKEQLVKELESYKKSLIYEVVTGKREV